MTLPLFFNIFNLYIRKGGIGVCLRYVKIAGLPVRIRRVSARIAARSCRSHRRGSRALQARIRISRMRMVRRHMGRISRMRMVRRHMGRTGYGMAPGLGMGWYKFVIYFQLFASALINGIAGIVALTGAHYEGEADLVYTFIPSLSTVDKLYGIVLIALAVFAIIVRFQLAQFKKTGPKFYLLLLLISGIASLIYLIAAGAIVSDFGIEIEYSSQISQLIVSAALLVANYIYFQKRSNLFVN